MDTNSPHIYVGRVGYWGDRWMVHGLTSPPTQYRLYGRRGELAVGRIDCESQIALFQIQSHDDAGAMHLYVRIN